MTKTIKMPTNHVSAIAIEKAYRKGEHKVPVLRGVKFAAMKGDFISIVGQSGSGKSTLLHLMGLLDQPDVGEIVLDGQRVTTGLLGIPRCRRSHQLQQLLVGIDRNAQLRPRPVGPRIQKGVSR